MNLASAPFCIGDNEVLIKALAPVLMTTMTPWMRPDGGVVFGASTLLRAPMMPMVMRKGTMTTPILMASFL